MADVGSAAALGTKQAPNPADYRTTFDSYNKLGEPTHVTDPLGRVTQRGYDADGRVTSVTDQNNQTTSYGYDAAGQLTGVNLPGTSADPAFTYWPDGTLNTSTDRAGRTTTYTYDPLGHVATATDPAGRVTTEVVDAVGNVVSVAQPGGSCAAPITSTSRCVQFAYDAADRMSSVTYSDPATPSITAVSRDRDGRVLSTTRSDSATESWVYDNLGRLTSSNDGGDMSVRVGDPRHAERGVVTLERPRRFLGRAEPVGAGTRHAVLEAMHRHSPIGVGHDRGPRGRGVVERGLMA